MSSRLEQLIQLPQIPRPKPIVVVQQYVETVAQAGESQGTRDEGGVPHCHSTSQDDRRTGVNSQETSTKCATDIFTALYLLSR